MSTYKDTDIYTNAKKNKKTKQQNNDIKMCNQSITQEKKRKNRTQRHQ